MLKMAIALCTLPARVSEGLEMLQNTEKLFHELSGEILDSDSHDLLFHLLFEIQSDLHN